MSRYGPEAFKVTTRGWDVIGEGSFGRVYGSDASPLVHKYAINDGTRTYLEWVIQRTLEGKRMRGMPWVERLRPEARGRYSVVMQRYSPLEWWESAGDNPPYISDLMEAFERETGVEANDIQYGNLMKDERGDWVLTDPSSDSYVPLQLH